MLNALHALTPSFLATILEYTVILFLDGRGEGVIRRHKAGCSMTYMWLSGRDTIWTEFSHVCYTRLLLLHFTTSHSFHLRDLNFSEFKSFTQIALTSKWWGKEQKRELLEGNGVGYKEQRLCWETWIGLYVVPFSNNLCWKACSYFIVTPNPGCFLCTLGQGKDRWRRGTSPGIGNMEF